MRALRVNPILNVSDLQASFAWFAKLGWAKNWDWCPPGGAPTFGAVGSGAVEIFLSLDGQGGRGASSGVWMSLWVDDVDAVHERCVREGIEVRMPPRDEPWGVREMHVQHPDGHVFRIGQPLPHEHDHSHGDEHGHDHSHAALRPG